ncbi:unnamed protein product [Adineta ricciae]|uniref:Tetraspanin n=1 Tax=Adineta ricciae TaxID=249248 RepID=A0A814A798_ADIRI|nr:unnamed protein product [Adineta ricciae]CAF0910658.1 unnamed protein product [Adineta ricciae]
MVSSQAQPSATSLTQEANSFQSLSVSDLNTQNSLADKFRSGIKWIISPLRQCCSSSTSTNRSSLKPITDSRCLKPEFNRVNGFLKYFSFGVMFTNGILGFILFFIGLWSSFEHRKISHMPTINQRQSSCLGINRENLNLLRISIVGQFLTLVIFLSSATIILVWGGRIHHKIGETMMTGLKMHYHIDEGWAAFFDKLQKSYFCCGVYSFDDWNNNPNYACTQSNLHQNIDACSVPLTCCKTPSKNDRHANSQLLTFDCGQNVSSINNTPVDMNEIQERININGCFDEILPVIQQLIITTGVFLLLICIIIFVTIFLTYLLAFEIRLTKSDVQRYCQKQRRSYTDDDTF